MRSILAAIAVVLTLSGAAHASSVRSTAPSEPSASVSDSADAENTISFDDERGLNLVIPNDVVSRSIEQDRREGLIVRGNDIESAPLAAPTLAEPEAGTNKLWRVSFPQ